MESLVPGESIGTGISAEQLAEEIGLDRREIAWRKEFLDFTDEDEERLASLSGVVEAKEDELVEAFIEPILADERTREIVGRSPRTNDQFEAIVAGYLRTFTGGTYDERYYAHRCRIGRLHDRLDMPLHYFGGMFGNFLNILLDEIESTAVESATESLSDENAADVEASIGEGFADARAAVRGANLDMQVVNDTYLHSYSRAMREEVAQSREMRERIAGTVESLRAEASSAAAGVDTIDALAAEQTANTEELADGLSDLSASVEEVAATADQVSTTSTRAEELADEGHEAAASAAETMGRVDDARGEITERVDTLVDTIDEIDGIVEVINGIAEQTNLLALNASTGIEEVTCATDDQAETSAELAQRVDDTADRADEVAAELDDLLESVRSQSETATEIDEALGELESVEAAAGDADDRARTRATTDGGTEARRGRRGSTSASIAADGRTAHDGSQFEWDDVSSDDSAEEGSLGGSVADADADGARDVADDGLPTGMPDFVKGMLDEETKAKIRRGELDRPDWTT